MWEIGGRRLWFHGSLGILEVHPGEDQQRVHPETLHAMFPSSKMFPKASRCWLSLVRTKLCLSQKLTWTVLRQRQSASAGRSLAPTPLRSFLSEVPPRYYHPPKFPTKRDTGSPWQMSNCHLPRSLPLTWNRGLLQPRENTSPRPYNPKKQ